MHILYQNPFKLIINILKYGSNILYLIWFLLIFIQNIFKMNNYQNIHIEVLL